MYSRRHDFGKNPGKPYYIGAMLESNPEAEESELAVSQWFPYEYERQATNHISVIESLDNIRRYLKKNKLRALTTNTQIIIAPGYKYTTS